MAGEKGTGFASAFLAAVFQASFPASGAGQYLWNNASSSPLTNLYVALHTADPGAGGSQSTNEVTTGAYTGYARVTVARTSGGWTVTSNSVSPAATISFPACTGGTGATATYFSVGTNTSGAGNILYAGPISPSIVITNGVTPQLTTSSTITES